MYREKKEIREYHKEIVTHFECVCDVCGNKIFEKNLVDDKYHCKKLAKYPYYITFGHNDWGNDSTDSVESKHACSDECLASIFLDYVEHYSKENNSAYINIENDYYRGSDEYVQNISD